MKPSRDDPDEPPLSHHEQPKPAGSDSDHEKEKEKLKDKRRSWKELHSGKGRHPKTRRKID